MKDVDPKKHSIGLYIISICLIYPFYDVVQRMVLGGMTEHFNFKTVFGIIVILYVLNSTIGLILKKKWCRKITLIMSWPTTIIIGICLPIILPIIIKWLKLGKASELGPFFIALLFWSSSVFYIYYLNKKSTKAYFGYTEPENAQPQDIRIMICPKCKRIFDDSWKICLSCNIPLAEKTGLQNGMHQNPSPTKDIKVSSNIGQGLIVNGIIYIFISLFIGGAAMTVLLKSNMSESQLAEQYKALYNSKRINISRLPEQVQPEFMASVDYKNLRLMRESKKMMAHLLFGCLFGLAGLITGILLVKKHILAIKLTPTISAIGIIYSLIGGYFAYLNQTSMHFDELAQRMHLDNSMHYVSRVFIFISTMAYVGFFIWIIIFIKKKTVDVNRTTF